MDDGYEKSNELCKQICVFMVRGLYDNWKFVLSYVAASNGLSSIKLRKLIDENITAAHSLGLNIRSIVCDQGPNNRGALFKNGVNLVSHISI